MVALAETLQQEPAVNKDLFVAEAVADWTEQIAGINSDEAGNNGGDREQYLEALVRTYEPLAIVSIVPNEA